MIRKNFYPISFPRLSLQLIFSISKTQPTEYVRLPYYLLGSMHSSPPLQHNMLCLYRCHSNSDQSVLNITSLSSHLSYIGLLHIKECSHVLVDITRRIIQLKMRSALKMRTCQFHNKNFCRIMQHSIEPSGPINCFTLRWPANI